MPDLCLEKSVVLQSFNFHRSDVTTCDFDDQFRLASGSSDKTVMVWEWIPGRGYVETKYSPITEYKYGVSNVMFLPSKSILAVSSFDGSISLWDVQNGSVLHTFMHENLVGVRCSCFVPNVKFLISAGNDGTLCVWDIDRRTLVRTVQTHEETITVVCSSYDGKIILSGDTTGSAKIWHMSRLSDTDVTVLPINILKDCHDLGVNHADFSRSTLLTDEGKVYTLATCGSDNILKLWKLTISKENDLRYHCRKSLIVTLTGHASSVTCVKFSPCGTFIASSAMDKTTRLWKVGGDYRCLKVLERHSRYVTTCSFSPDGKLLATGSNDKQLIVWDLTGQLSVDSHLLQIITSPKMNTSSSSSSLFKTKNSLKILQKLENLGNAINSCCFSKDNLLAAGGTDKLMRLWHRSSSINEKFVEVSISPLQAHHYAINQVDFSLCGTMLASCSVDGTTILWDITEYKQKGTLYSTEGGVKACRFSPDSRILATGGDSETVNVWRVDNQQLITNMTGHTETVVSLAFTCDSKYLASGCAGGHLRLWCAFPCTTICMLYLENVHDLGLISMDFPQIALEKKEKYLLATCGNDSLVKIWSIMIKDEITATGALVKQMQGHGGDVTCVRFLPDSFNIVASTATDKTCRIWQIDTGSCLHVLDSKDTMLTCCSFSADGSLLATGGLDKAIIIWDLRGMRDDFEIFACNRLECYANNIEDWKENEKYYQANQLTNVNHNKFDISSLDAPHEYTCPITQHIMSDPVFCADGYSYERKAIESWFCSGKNTSPMTNEILTTFKLVPNNSLKSSIKSFVNMYSMKDNL